MAIFMTCFPCCCHQAATTTADQPEHAQNHAGQPGGAEHRAVPKAGGFELKFNAMIPRRNHAAEEITVTALHSGRRPSMRTPAAVPALVDYQQVCAVDCVSITKVPGQFCGDFGIAGPGRKSSVSQSPARPGLFPPGRSVECRAPDRCSVRPCPPARAGGKGDQVSRTTFSPVPEGQSKIAQQFTAGSTVYRTFSCVPSGRLKETLNSAVLRDKKRRILLSLSQR